MPLRIDAASADNLSASCWLNYSISNLGNEQINEISFTIFLVDSKSKIRSVVEALKSEAIPGGAKQQDQIFISDEIEDDELAVIAVKKAVSDSGVWRVDDSALMKALSANLTNGLPVEPTVKYQTHTVLTDEDRREILKIILDDLLHDKKKSERFSDHSRLIFLRERSGLQLPSLDGKTLLLLDANEIQGLADKEGRIIYFSYPAVVTEGSRIHAQITLRDVMPRRPGMGIPYKFTFAYTLRNHKGGWKIERAIGYS